MVCPCQLSHLPGYFSLREEARKSWEYCISDKLVHSEKIFYSSFESLRFISEENVDFSRCWIELHFVLKRDRYIHYAAVIEFFDRETSGFRDIQFEEPVCDCTMRGNVPMLVDVPKLIESPEVCGFVVIPTLVRLKRLHDGDCRVGDTESTSRDFNLCIDSVFVANGETNFSCGNLSAKKCKLPSKVVEARAQASNKVPSHQRYGETSVIVRELKPDDIPAIFEIVLGRNYVLVRLPKNIDFDCERIKMFLRPLQLQIGIEHVCHTEGWYFNSFG